MNLTTGNIEYIPSKQAVDWCLAQHIPNINNIQTYSIMFIALSIILLMIAEYFIIKDKANPYAMNVIFAAKISLYCFFFVYFTVLKV